VTNINEGNAFLDGYLLEYNKRFAKEAAKKADLHRPVVNKRALDTILATRRANKEEIEDPESAQSANDASLEVTCEGNGSSTHAASGSISKPDIHLKGTVK